MCWERGWRRTGWMLLSINLRINNFIVPTSLLTPLSSTLWFRTVTAFSNSLSAAHSVIHEISPGWLKCVWSATLFPPFLPKSLIPINVSVHSSAPSRVRDGQTNTPYSQSGSGARCRFRGVVLLLRIAAAVRGRRNHRRILRSRLRRRFGRCSRTLVPSILEGGESVFWRLFRFVSLRHGSVCRSGIGRGRQILLRLLGRESSWHAHF